MQQARVAFGRKYTPEEKVPVVLEGFRREAAVTVMNAFEMQTKAIEPVKVVVQA